MPDQHTIDGDGRAPSTSRRAPRALMERPTAHQLVRIRRLLEHTYVNNPFYRTKYRAAGIHSLAALREALRTADGFRCLPLTTKGELLDDQAAHPPYGTNLAASPRDFVRQHRTSGTTGRPLKVWDTRASWRWMTGLWLQQLRALDISATDTVFMAFNFGPSLGFWNSLDAAMQIGALTLSGGGLTSVQRVEAIVDNRATVLIGTPSYALRLAETAAEHGIDPATSQVRAIIAAGEPGASIPSIRDRIERRWSARLFDSPGATEVGHTGLACLHQHVHINESGFCVEMIDATTSKPATPGQAAEIVVTNFGRPATPVIRYRTGDMARAVYNRCACGRITMRLDGGILGRSDDMFIVRGLNVFPSAIEAVIRESDDVMEYAVEVLRDREMASLKVRLEVNPAARAVNRVADQIKEALHRRLYVKAETEVVPPHTLPRFDGKAARVVCR